jgi:hypothetical protein
MPSPRAYGGRRLASSNMGGGSLRTLVAKQCLRSLGRQVRNPCEPVPDESIRKQDLDRWR